MSVFKSVTIEKGLHFKDRLEIKDDGMIEYCESFFAREDEGDRDDYIQIMFDDYSNKISFEDIESFLKNLKTEDRFEKLKNFLNEKSVKFKNDFWVSF